MTAERARCFSRRCFCGVLFLPISVTSAEVFRMVGATKKSLAVGAKLFLFFYIIC